MSKKEQPKEKPKMRNAIVEEGVNIDEYIALQRELDELRRQHGLVKEGKISHMISSFFERRESREKVLVNRKKLLLLAVFTGWMGGHRFYTRQYKLAVCYLLFFWTGVPMAMTIIDLLEFIPIPVDENGNILV